MRVRPGHSTFGIVTVAADTSGDGCAVAAGSVTSTPAPTTAPMPAPTMALTPTHAPATPTRSPTTASAPTVCVHVRVPGALRWDTPDPYMEGGRSAQTAAPAPTLTIAASVSPLKTQTFGHRAYAGSITVSTTSVQSSTAAQHRLAAWWRSQPPDEVLAGPAQEASAVINSTI